MKAAPYASRKWFVASMAAVALCVAPFVSDLAAQSLSWSFSAGDRFDVEVNQTVRQKTEVLKKPLEVTTVTQMQISWEVLEVNPDGSAKLAQSFRRLALNVSTGDEEDLAYDSASESKPTGLGAELAKAMKPLLDTPIQITMTPRGEITKVEASEEALAKLREAAGSMRLRKALTIDGLQEMLSPLSLPLPEEDLEVGTTWKHQRTSATEGLSVQVTHDFQFEGEDTFEDGSAQKITFTTQLKPAGKEQEDDPKSTKIESQKSDGVIWFDTAAGNPVMCRQTQSLVTSSQLREFPMTVSASSESTCRVTRLPRE